MVKDEEKETLKSFVELLRNIGSIRKRREESLERMFWEFNNYNIDLFEDKESKILKYIPEPTQYPKAFLASNLGFNRATMDQRFHEILNKFKLEKRSTSGSIRNALYFEVLKKLLIKYFESKK
jgi:hypothetical protein